MASLSLQIPTGYGSKTGTITYDETPDSPQESMGGNVFRSRRTFIVPWSKRWLFSAGMVGWPFLRLQSGSSSSYWVSRVTPQGYSATDFDPNGTAFLYATSIENIQGQGKITGYDSDSVAQFQKAKISIGYESLSYRVRSDMEILTNAVLLDQEIEDADYSDTGLGVFAGGAGVDEASLIRYITRFRQPTAEYLTLPLGALKWVQQNPTPTPAGSIGKIIAAQELHYTWHQVPNVPEAAKKSIGSLNNTWFDGYPRGTLLFVAVELKPYRWFFNQRVWDITYKFKFFSPVPSNSAEKVGGLSIYAQDSSNGLWYDTRRDGDVAPGVPVGEYLGHNHFLRTNFSDTSGPSILRIFTSSGSSTSFTNAPAYQMMTNDGKRPYNNTSTTNISSALLQTGAQGTTTINLQPNSGVTLYPYSNFSDLFRPDPPVTPAE